MRKEAQLAALFLAATLAAVAQDSGAHVYRVKHGEWIEETNGTLPAGKTVKVKTTAGPIRLNGARQDYITYTVRKVVHASSEDAAQREFASLRFTATNGGDIALFHGECGMRGYVGFDLNVPAQTKFVRIDTRGGTISAKNIAGRVEAVTGGESIQLDDIGGSAYAFSGGGNIEIGKVGGDVQVETHGGSIHIVSAGGRVTASSGGGMLVIGTGKNMSLHTRAGSIQVNKCDGPIKASTGGGSIDLKDVAGSAELESGGGSIRAGLVRGGLRADTGSGPIVVKLTKDGGAFTDSRLETSAGDIVVYIPEDLGLTIRAAVEVARGSGIRTEFDGVKVTNANQLGPHEVFAEGSLNGGGPLLHVHTTNGTIEFKREGK
jgi:DUF4097 and DUF4098 domain-containing protein YvlB